MQRSALRLLVGLCVALLLVSIDAKRGMKSKSKGSKRAKAGHYKGAPQKYHASPLVNQPHNIFQKGKGGSKSNRIKSKGKGKGKGGVKKNMNKGHLSKGSPMFSELTFTPRIVPTGRVTEINVLLQMIKAPNVDSFNLYRFDIMRGQKMIPEAMLLRDGPSSLTYQGSFGVLSNFQGELFSYRAIPVIDGVEDPFSPYVVIQLGALRSISVGLGPPLTQVPTTPDATRQPTRAPTTVPPSSAPVISAPITETPTSAPTTTTSSEPTTQMPTSVSRAPATTSPTATQTASLTLAPGFGEILSIQGAVGAEFGRSVALSSDASFLAVGAPANSEFGAESGRVGLYQIVDGAAESLFDFSGGQAGLRVGTDVAISSMEGVGGPRLAIGGVDFVDVYPLNQFLNDELGQDLDFDRFEPDFVGEGFGTAVSMSGDGGFVAVGSPLAPIRGGFDVGLVKVFRIGSNAANIGGDINGDDTSDLFGTSISLSADGDIVAIGAPGNIGAGYARVYRLSGSGLVWETIGQTLIGLQAGDTFGRSIALSDDGLTVAIGASQVQSGLGYVQVYAFVGSTWTQVGEDLLGPMENDQFGMSVALTPDARYLAVGANAHDSGDFMNNGLVQVYEDQDGTWVQVGPAVVGSANSRNLGVGLAISSDGRTVAAGGPLSTSDPGRGIGEAVLFQV